jgi:hypothetical protein
MSGLPRDPIGPGSVPIATPAIPVGAPSTWIRARRKRRCTRSVLGLALDTLIENDQQAAADRVQVALDQASVVPDDDQRLLEQLDTLVGVLGDPLVTEAIADRGGESITQRLTDAHAALMSSIRQRAATPEISAVADERDTLDGIIVSLARAARNAARAAARDLGQPAIEVEFRLTHLTPRSDSDPRTRPPRAPRGSRDRAGRPVIPHPPERAHDRALPCPGTCQPASRLASLPGQRIFGPSVSSRNGWPAAGHGSLTMVRSTRRFLR